MIRLLALITLTFQSILLFSQKSAAVDTLAPKQANLTSPSQVETLSEAFKKGHVSGGFRNYFMATDNTRQLSDYHAWASGGNLFFSTAAFHGFSLGIGGSAIVRLAGSDLSQKDSTTGASNRYEIGLYDVTDPANRKNLSRLESSWLRYQWKTSSITVGKQSLQTPFINKQDGRMRPTVGSGVWAEILATKNTEVLGGWLWRIAPRSTVGWYNIGTSIGIYPKGLNPDGSASAYPTNVKSAGIGLLGLKQQLGKHSQVQIWNQYVENVFNTAFIQFDHRYPLTNKQQLIFGLQYTRQDALANGGNENTTKAYFPKGGKSNVLSTQAGWQYKGWLALLAYTRTSADGRFLAPREWGREPFYTFMPRERIEGAGDIHAITGRLNWKSPDKKFRIEGALGYFDFPDVKTTALNKYGLPSFNQFDFDARYAFGGILQGLKVQFLYVRKMRVGPVYGIDKYVLNKVDMAHYNLVLNYEF